LKHQFLKQLTNTSKLLIDHHLTLLDICVVQLVLQVSCLFDSLNLDESLEFCFSGCFAFADEVLDGARSIVTYCGFLILTTVVLPDYVESVYLGIQFCLKMVDLALFGAPRFLLTFHNVDY
jgi:hypothetical protein